MNRRLAVLLAATCALLAALPVASAAAKIKHKTETATSGPVTATLTYQQKNAYTFQKLRLQIVRGGVTALDVPVTSAGCSDFCWPASAGLGQHSSVSVRDLDGDGEPEVLLDLYTGGAHCCLMTQVYSLIPGDQPSYARREHAFLDAGYDIKDLNGDGIPEFQTVDARLLGSVTSYAASAAPVQILRFQGGDLADVTHEFPALVQKDSRSWFKQYRKNVRRRAVDHEFGVGALLAWAADEEILGHDDRVQTELSGALKRGWLKTEFATGKRTLRTINQVLHQTGYR